MKHSYRYVAQPQFWRNFRKLPREQWVSVRKAWEIFKQDPFDSRLGTHKIHKLSAIFNRTVYAVVVEGDLRITFYLRGGRHGSDNQHRKPRYLQAMIPLGFSGNL